LAALVIIGAGPAYARYLHAQDPASPSVARAAPEAQGPWRQVPWTSSWRPVYVGATEEVFQAYSNGEDTAELFVALYASQDQGRKLIGFNNRLEDGENWRRIYDTAGVLPIDGAERPVLMRRIDGREGTRFVSWVYWIDGHWTTSAIEARIRYVVGKLIYGRSRAGLLVLSSASSSERAARSTAGSLLNAIPDLATTQFPSLGSIRESSPN
jgi:EpsI family protein